MRTKCDDRLLVLWSGRLKVYVKLIICTILLAVSLSCKTRAFNRTAPESAALTSGAMEPLANSFSDEFFAQYLFANSVAPQLSIFIVSTFVCYLVRDPSIDIEDFLDQKLSTKQIQQLGETMDKLHRGSKVDYKMNWELKEEKSAKESYEVAPARLQRLFSDIRFESMLVLSGLKRVAMGKEFFEKPTFLREFKDPTLATVEAELFLTIQRTEEVRKQLKDGCDELAQWHKNRDVLLLLARWRKDIEEDHSKARPSSPVHRKALAELKSIIRAQSQVPNAIDLLFMRFSSKELDQFIAEQNKQFPGSEP